MSEEDFNTFASTGDGSMVPKRGVEGLSEVEQTAMSRMALMAFKVLTFASIARFKPQVTLDPPTKRQGGKPGFMNRPKTKRVIVQYLPRHLDERRQARTEAGGGKHTFRGRRGHLRRYRSERYVNKKGCDEWIYPVPAPDGSVPKRVFKVVK